MTMPNNHQNFGPFLTALTGWLGRPVDAASLGAFRLLFGALMVWEVWRYYNLDFIGRYYIEPRFHFTYEFFPFFAPLPGQGMYWLFGAMGLFALGLALGFYYRWSAFLFFLSYTYVFLLDKTPYNNHYYLISLLSFLLILVDGQRWFSLDGWHKRDPASQTVPFWQLFILRAQFFIVYFYGGLAKLNRDWLMGEPMRMWLAERTHYPLLGPFFETETAVYFFSYGGLLFDLSIGFLLLWRPTRLLAFGSLLFFHLMNSWLFTIGIFPFLALAATLLFVEPEWPRRVWQRIYRPASDAPVNLPQPARLNVWTFSFIGLYLALQLLVPLRHWLYPGEVSWTEEGHRFAWHMKLRDKEARLEIKVIDPRTGEVWKANLAEDLTADQIEKMGIRPDMILQYTHHLRDKLIQSGLDNPIIIANAWASLNGRPFQQLIDPRDNLAQIEAHPLAPSPWILPLTTDLPRSAEPVQSGLIFSTLILANLGLALTIYLTVGYKNNLLVRLNSSNHTGIVTRNITVPLEVVANLLPYLGILLALAAWVVTMQVAYLGVILLAALLASGWGLVLAARFGQADFFARLTPIVGSLAGLFGLILFIVGVPG